MIAMNVKVNGKTFVTWEKQERNLIRTWILLKYNTQKPMVIYLKWVHIQEKTKSDMTSMGYEFVGLCYYTILRNNYRGIYVHCWLILHFLTHHFLHSSVSPYLFRVLCREYIDTNSPVSALYTWKKKIKTSSHIDSLVGGSKPISCQFPRSILNSSHFSPLAFIGGYINPKKCSGVAKQLSE